MADLRRYHTLRAKIAAELEADFVYITSLDSFTTDMKGGVVTQASRDVAASRIAGDSHRLSTSEEIAAHLKSEEEKKKLAASTAIRTGANLLVETLSAVRLPAAPLPAALTEIDEQKSEKPSSSEKAPETGKKK